MPDQILNVDNLSKSFAGVRALQGVNLTMERGEIRCLVGENGCGKSTLIKVIAGVVQPDEGTVTLNGRQYRQIRPIDAIREGIQVIYQDFSLFPNLTVAENIAFNYNLARKKQLVNWRDINRIAREAIAKIGVDLDLGAYVEDLPVADKQIIAI
ncbi:MAG TPA: lipase, partial [Firmicutes bacterium]|nr:lipase [Bacillota bacterium]HCX70048.1 lipase [Bacillota bacterium]